MLEQVTKQVERYRGWLIITPQNSRPRQLGNQPPNATSYPQTPICKGGHLLPSHPIGSLQLTNLAPSALAERDQVPVSGSARSLSPKSCPPELSFPLQPYSFSAFPFLVPLNHHPPFPTPQIKCLHARESRKKRRRSCRLCLATKARKKKSKALFLTSCIALCVRVVN